MDDYKGLSTRLLNAAQSYAAYQVGGEFADMLTDAARAIDDLTVALAASNEVIAKSKPRWIPVTERLPVKDGSHYLAYDGRDVCEAVFFGGLFGGWYDPVDEWAVYTNVTHWMPLPEPPEVRKDG